MAGSFEGNIKKTASYMLHPDDQWDIFRGDSFQLKLSVPENSLKSALLIRSGLKSIHGFYKLNMDVRISIGIGEEGYKSQNKI